MLSYYNNNLMYTVVVLLMTTVGLREAFWLAIFVNFATFCVLISAHQLECCSLIYDNVASDVAVV